ncbi:hypothetical protein D3C85_1105310 [compost metagenome]
MAGIITWPIGTYCACDDFSIYPVTFKYSFSNSQTFIFKFLAEFFKELLDGDFDRCSCTDWLQTGQAFFKFLYHVNRGKGLGFITHSLRDSLK